MKKTILSALVCVSCLPALATEVFTWKNGSHTSYSDTPRNLQRAGSHVVNFRTMSSVPAVKPEVKPEAENEAEAKDKEAKEVAEKNRQIAEKNKQVEEHNKKVGEENQKNKAESCRVSRMNQKIAASSTAKNKDELLRRYQADVNKFCQ